MPHRWLCPLWSRPPSLGRVSFDSAAATRTEGAATLRAARGDMKDALEGGTVAHLEILLQPRPEDVPIRLHFHGVLYQAVQAGRRRLDHTYLATASVRALRMAIYVNHAYLHV